MKFIYTYVFAIYFYREYFDDLVIYNNAQRLDNNDV